MIKYVSISLLTIVLTYLTYAFVAADINPFNWSQEYRLLLVVTAFIFAVGAVTIFAQEGDSDD